VAAAAQHRLRSPFGQHKPLALPLASHQDRHHLSAVQKGMENRFTTSVTKVEKTARKIRKASCSDATHKLRH
jgi:hypothetical protein